LIRSSNAWISENKKWFGEEYQAAGAFEQ